MAWVNGQGRTSTAEWKRLVRWARKHLPYECARCGIDGRDAPLELDHITPVTEGGADEESNVAWLCRDVCHKRKSKAEAARGRARAAAKAERARLLGRPTGSRVPARQRIHPSGA